MEGDSMNYKIEIKDIAPVKVVSIRFKGKYTDVGKHIGKLYKTVKGKASDVPFNCYYDNEYKEEADMELCLPVSKLVSDSQIISKELPGIKAITTIHTGPYENLNKAYKAILDYAQQHNLNIITPSRERYIKGPGFIFKGNPNNYVTEIIMPIK
jgi:effector-binding domain-containing protein